jgi:hypothetical protein
MPVRPLGSSTPGLSGTQIENDPAIFISKATELKNMEYVIVFGVAAIMGLYVLVLAHYLRDA